MRWPIADTEAYGQSIGHGTGTVETSRVVHLTYAQRRTWQYASERDRILLCGTHKLVKNVRLPPTACLRILVANGIL